jgi:hypothetical protein
VRSGDDGLGVRGVDQQAKPGLRFPGSDDLFIKLRSWLFC